MALPQIVGSWIIFDDGTVARWAEIDHVYRTTVVNPPPAPPTIKTRCLLKSRIAFDVEDGLKKVVDALTGAV